MSSEQVASSETAKKSMLINSLQNALRRKRKLETSEEEPTSSNKDIKLGDKEQKDDNQDQEELRQKAREIIKRDSKRSAERASTMGPQGW